MVDNHEDEEDDEDKDKDEENKGELDKEERRKTRRMMRWWMRTRMTTHMMENNRMSWMIQIKIRTMMEKDKDNEYNAMMRWVISRPLLYMVF